MNKKDWDIRYKLLKKNGNVGSMSWDINDKVIAFQKLLALLIPVKRFKTVIDFGCGTGKNTDFLIKLLGAKQYIGYDIVKLVVDEMNKKYKRKKGIDFRLFAGEIKKVDCIFSSFCLQHMNSDDYMQTLHMFKKALNKNGRIYIIDSCAYYNILLHEQFFDVVKLNRKLLKKTDDNILIYEVWQ